MIMVIKNIESEIEEKNTNLLFLRKNKQKK